MYSSGYMFHLESGYSLLEGVSTFWNLEGGVIFWIFGMMFHISFTIIYHILVFVKGVVR